VEKAKVELREYALRFVNDHIDRGLFPGPHYDDLDAAIDAGHYLLWDGPTAVTAISQVAEEFPLIEDVHFMVTAGRARRSSTRASASNTSRAKSHGSVPTRR
jgi:hypothetical protein